MVWLLGMTLGDMISWRSVLALLYHVAGQHVNKRSMAHLPRWASSDPILTPKDDLFVQVSRPWYVFLILTLQASADDPLRPCPFNLCKRMFFPLLII